MSTGIPFDIGGKVAPSLGAAVPAAKGMVGGLAARLTRVRDEATRTI